MDYFHYVFSNTTTTMELKQATKFVCFYYIKKIPILISS